MPRKKREKAEDEVIAAVCTRFMAGTSFGKIAKEVEREIRGHSDPQFRLSRQETYLVIQDAIRLDRFFYAPPAHQLNARHVAERFGLDLRHIHVAHARLDVERVAASAAELVLKRIDELDKAEVHIGFAAGGTAMRVARHLGARLRSFKRSVKRPLKLGIHAMSSGFSVKHPDSSPVSFFSDFRGTGHETEFFGLYCTPMVETRGLLEQLRGQLGVSSAFDEAEKLDIIVTSLCGADDPDGDLMRAVAESRLPRKADRSARYGEMLKQLQRSKWVGEVMGLPFNDDGPIDPGDGPRAVTLRDLHELVAFAAQDQKHVILVAGPCFACRRTRELPLVPLLRSPELALWTDLVVDIETAEKLLQLGASSTPRAAAAGLPRQSASTRRPRATRSRASGSPPSPGKTA